MDFASAIASEWRKSVYSTSIEELIRRLSELMQARRKLDAAIARTQMLVRTQAILRHQRPTQHAKTAVGLEKPTGFTDAIRLVLATYDIWLTPTAIRDLLPSVGLDSTSSKNLLVSTHTVLKRLVRNNVAVCKNSGVEVLYRHAESHGSSSDQIHLDRTSHRNNNLNGRRVANTPAGTTRHLEV